MPVLIVLRGERWRTKQAHSSAGSMRRSVFYHLLRLMALKHMSFHPVFSIGNSLWKQWISVISEFNDQEQKRKPPYRYVVEECRTGFMDAEVFHTICKLPERMCIDYLIDFDKDENEDTEFRCAVGSSEDGELTAALLTIMKSGVYYWYWGKDCNGDICCLFADFFTYR